MVGTGRYTLRKKTRGWHSVKYLGRYLKRLRLSASCLRHYADGAVVYHYLDHRMEKYKRQMPSQKDMIEHDISHVPSRHFEMMRYSVMV